MSVMAKLSAAVVEWLKKPAGLCSRSKNVKPADFIGAITVVVFEDEEAKEWVAQGLEYDVSTRGATHEEARNRFTDSLVNYLMECAKEGLTPFAGIPPASEDFWELYHAQMDETVH